MSSELSLFNTLSRRKERFVPARGRQVSMYVCGMTIYDYCHMGHARMLMAFDVIARWLRASGYALTYARNITDIDDKIIKRALENAETIGALTQRFTAIMHADLAALGILPPDIEPRATQHVPAMLNIIGLLEAKGLAYKAADGDVNFAVRRLRGYGKLSGKSLDELRAGERVAVSSAKDDPLDFVLWKSAKPSEPAEAKWASPWGEGRPGWHIECSAMCEAVFGRGLDIHGGGEDLQFPHHENEIAQSEGAFEAPFARYWVHNGFLNVDNTKMSKSLNNFFTIRDVLASYNAEVVRFFMLRTHYRSQFNYADRLVEDAKGALTRLYITLKECVPDAGALDWNEAYALRFKAAMDDDFNTPLALSVLHELSTEVNKSKSAQLSRQLKQLGILLGVLQSVPDVFLKGSASGNGDAEAARIEGLIAERADAKKARDFARADAIRAALQAEGVLVEDGPAGASWRRA